MIGNSAGTTLYVSDASAGVTYEYSISEGTATGQTVFAAVAATAMDIDTEGNVYLATASGVEVYSSAGTLLATISTPAQPIALCFGGNEKRTLFITTASGLYSIGGHYARRHDQRRADDRRDHADDHQSDIEHRRMGDQQRDRRRQLCRASISATRPAARACPPPSSRRRWPPPPTPNGSSWTGTGANNAWTVTEPSGDNTSPQTDRGQLRQRQRLRLAIHRAATPA